MGNQGKIQNNQGASAIELVMVLPILLSILFGTIEYGWFFKKKMDLNNAVAEGVRAIVYTEGGGKNNAINAIVEVLMENGDYGAVIAKLNGTLNYTTLQNPDRAKLSINGWQHDSLTGFFPSALLPESISATAVMAFP